jgi:L-malate glycosyltransferase
MKLLYISANAPRIFKLMEDMVSRGHDVYWVALNHPKYRIKGVKIFNEITVEKESIFFKYFGALYKFILFRKILHEVSPDILHAINVRKAGWFTAFSGFTPSVISTQGGDILAYERNYNHKHRIRLWLREKFILGWLRKYSLRKVSAITYGNIHMLDAVQNYANPKQGFLYFSGINFNTNSPSTDKVALRNKLEIAEKKIVFSPRMFNSNSNIDTIIKTIPLVKKTIPNIYYIFACHAGVSNYRTKIMTIIQELGVEDCCTILDEIPSSMIHEYYSISDVVVSVVSSDGMPSTILESMANKKALVISDIPVYKKVFVNLTYTAKVRNEFDTAKTIINCIRDNNQTINYIERAYTWVKDNADSKDLNNKLEKFYYSLQLEYANKV